MLWTMLSILGLLSHVEAQIKNFDNCHYNREAIRILYELKLIEDTLRYTAIRCYDYYSKIHSYGINVKKLYFYNIETEDYDTSCYHVCKGNYVDTLCTIFCSPKIFRIGVREKIKTVSLDIEYIEDGWRVYCIDSFVPAVSAIALDSVAKYFFEGIISLANFVAIMGYINYCVYIDSISDTQIYYHIADCNLNNRDGEFQHIYKPFYFKGKVDWLKAYIFNSNDVSYEYYNIVYRLLYVNNNFDSLFYNQYHKQKQEIAFVKECNTVQQQNLQHLFNIVDRCDIIFSDKDKQYKLTCRLENYDVIIKLH